MWCWTGSVSGREWEGCKTPHWHIIDHSTTLRKLRPFLGVWQVTRKDDAAECKSTLDLLPVDLSLSCFGEGKLTQRSKRQGYRVFLCVMPFSWFLFCHVEHRHLTTCTKACQTISGLVRKTRGRLIIPRHAIGWNLRVCLPWLTGVESSIGASSKRSDAELDLFQTGNGKDVRHPISV